MYPLIRLAVTALAGRKAYKRSVATSTTLSFHDTSTITFRVRPWDIDMFFEMNNGRVLTLYDLGRFDLAIRTGLMACLKKENWGLVVAGSTVRYRKRVRAFDKVTLKTKMVGFDERWVYIELSMWVKGEPCNSALLRTGITEKGRVINPHRVEEAMNLAPLAFNDSPWMNAWIEAEDLRPWPPEH